jgi:hypothetical protein
MEEREGELRKQEMSVKARDVEGKDHEGEREKTV